MIEKRKRMVFRERRQPEAELGKVHGHRVLIDAVKASLSDEPPGVEEFVFIGRDCRQSPMNVPGLHKFVAQLPAGLNKECAAAHRRIADLEIEKLRGRGLFAEL